MCIIIMSLLDGSEISIDTIENRNSINDESTNTYDSTVLNNSNGSPSTGEEILNLSTVDNSNKGL